MTGPRKPSDGFVAPPTARSDNFISPRDPARAPAARPCDDLVAFADGELDADRAAAFRVHLRTCEVCRPALIEAVTLTAKLSELDTPRAQLERLRGLVQAWAAAREAWRTCPVWDFAKFAGAHRLFQAAEAALHAAVGLPTPADIAEVEAIEAEAAHAPVVELIGELPVVPAGATQDPDWKQRVLDEIDNPKGGGK